MGLRTSLVFLALFVTIISAQYTPQAQQQSAQQSSDTVPSSANVQYRARPYTNQYSNNHDEDEDDEDDDVPSAYQQQQRRPIPNQFRKPIQIKQQQEEEELEEEEPDRLSLLLEKSSFTCNGRTTGYYADEGLACEVFHYCQENQKHSWICPEGFTFHQVHLICMPPSSENICDQSSKYHFVNEYLYKPINMEEHQARPNVTLRYSERYYPESFYLDERNQDSEPYQSAPQAAQPQYHQEQRQRQPIQVGLRKPSPAPVQYRLPSSTPAPYRAPLLASTVQPSYRTPILTSTPSILHQQQQQQQQQAQQNAYRSPEDINISLQQRRPVLFASPTTHSYTTSGDDDREYNYEK